MPSIRARQGTTTLTLDGSSLHVAISGERFGPFAAEPGARQDVWRRLQVVNLPLRSGAMGVGGTGSEVGIELDGTRLTFEWWMAAPEGWDEIANVFRALAALVPRELRSRYDFGRGGE